MSLEISEDEKLTLGNEDIDQVDCFRYLGSIASKDSGCSEDVESKIAKVLSIFSQFKKVRRMGK